MEEIHLDIDYELLWRKVHGSISKEEEKLLANWLAKSSENQAYFDWVKDQNNGNIGLVKDSDTSVGWANMDRFITTHRRKKNRAIIGVAASVILAISFIYILVFQEPVDQVPKMLTANIESGSSQAFLVTSEGTIGLSDQNQDASSSQYSISKNGISYGDEDTKENEVHILKVPKGGEYQVVLSDGTKVWLNADTELKYPVSFQQSSRIVELKGEAYFEVAKDPNRPFEVHSDGHNVTVLGTQFNLSCYESKPVVTTLVEGSVSLADQYTENEVMLKPGEQASYISVVDSWKVEEVDVELYTAWKEGYYYFKKETLEDILETLARWYDVEFEFRNKKDAGIPFTGKLKKYEDLNEFLKLLEKTNEVEFEIENRKVLVK